MLAKGVLIYRIRALTMPPQPVTPLMQQLPESGLSSTYVRTRDSILGFSLLIGHETTRAARPPVFPSAAAAHAAAQLPAGRSGRLG
jgi:hypothetical protein